MPRPRMQVSHETLAEEARFILRTLMRKDLFGDRARLTEAERLIANSISMSFAEYTGFLNKYGYVRIDQVANAVEVTDNGVHVVKNGDDAEFYARLGRHFARELGTSPSLRPLRREPSAEKPRVEARAAVDPVREAPPRPNTEPRGPADEILDRRYRKGSEIGAGPVGTVYTGEHIALGRTIAVKEARSVFQYVSYIKRDEIVRRWKTVVQTHAGLVHPNIVQVVDQNCEREHPYVVTDYAEGGNLRQRLEAAKDGRLAVSQAIRILIQISYALKYAHSQGVLHLGIKPENVLFDHLGNVKLSDFGVSTIADREEHASQIPVLVGSGTVAYMSPERLQPNPGEDQQLGPAADIYAVGILTYQMLTGKLPGRRSPLPSQARKGKDIPNAFDDVFDKMTRDELSERYATVDDVLAGIYKAFPNKEVFSPGTILLWAEDPAPLPVPEPEKAEEPEPAEDEEKKADSERPSSSPPEKEAKEAKDDKASDRPSSSPPERVEAESQPPAEPANVKAPSEPPPASPGDDAKTGEVDVSAFQNDAKKPAKKRRRTRSAD